MSKPVFISYSTDDSAAAEQMRDGLEAASIGCWMAPRDIAPGLEYGSQIVAAIEECSVLALLLSESSNRSRFVLNEVERAVSKNKIVIPVRIHNVTPSRSLEFFISNAQWIDAWQGPLTTQIEVLATAIRNHLSTRAPADPAVDPIIRPPIPSLTHMAATPHINLPKPSTPFVGRATELAAIIGQLHDPACRLLTLLGQGGMGKTRLALEAARRIFDETTLSPDGVFFVALDSLATPEQIAPAVITALGLAVANQSDPRSHLLTVLGEKRLLLVLDNFEHLLEGATLVADMLAALPNVKLLVTSRAALNLPEEWFHPVGGMDLPATNAHTLEEMQSASAVQFFAQCGRRARPSFALADEAESVVQLCRLVDGTPLALELAAAWLRSLTCAQIVAELQGSLDLLSTSMRNVPQRHRSMQAVFDQSWQLLDEKERLILSQFVVFAGGFDWAAAKAVTSVAVPMLTALVDRSWLQVGEEGRYNLHPLVRSYLLVKFNTEYTPRAGETPDQVRDRHSRYYATLDMGRSAKIAEREAGNLRAGWLQATQTLDIATLTQYLNNGEIVYLLPGPATAELLAPTLARVRSAVDDAEATPQTDAMHRLMTRLLAYRANTLLVTGQSQKAEMLADECLVYLDRFPGADSDGSLRNEISLGFCWIQIARGRFQEADNVCKGVLATAQAQNDPDLQVGALVYLGYSAQERGRYDAAATYRHQGLELALAQKEANLYTFFAYLADVAYLTGKYTLAAQMLTKAAAFLDLVAPFQRLEQPIRWARLDIVDGDLAAARARCLSVLSKARDIAAKNVQVWALNELGRIALIEQQPEEAIGFFEQAVEVADEMGRCKEQARVRIGLGQAALAQARPDKALACFRQVIAIAWPQGILPEVLGALIGLAEIAAQQGNRRQAAEWLGTAAAHPATPHHIRQQAEALLTSLAENASLNAASLEEIVAVVLASAEESSVENTQ